MKPNLCKAGKFLGDCPDCFGKASDCVICGNDPCQYCIEKATAQNIERIKIQETSAIYKKDIVFTAPADGYYSIMGGDLTYYKKGDIVLNGDMQLLMPTDMVFREE